MAALAGGGVDLGLAALGRAQRERVQAQQQRAAAGCAAGGRRRRGSCAGARTSRSTLAAISLNELVSRRSSGGPVPSSARAVIRPVAISCAATSTIAHRPQDPAGEARGQQRAADHREQLAQDEREPVARDRAPQPARSATA